MIESYLQLKQQILNNEYARLNEMQRSAVLHTTGPLLILAGAGSGKTTVLVNRIAQILKFGDSVDAMYVPATLTQEDLDFMASWAAQPADDPAQKERARKLLAYNPCKPWNILAITFTNKAAAELRSRLVSMLGEQAEALWAFTFHGACLRMLRRNIELLGYRPGFTIYDTDDQLRLLKKCMADLSIDEKVFPPKGVLSSISRAKDQLLSPQAFLASGPQEFQKQKIAAVYELYQKRLKEAGALDFDDIIFLTVEILRTSPEVLSYYQEKFRYILVDEYQDTNHAQFMLVHLLAGGWKNICVVGDDDQSIYKFRGATIENILSFEENYENATVIKLEENYRCTQNILSAANSVIVHNEQRKGKELWTSKKGGAKVTFFKAVDEGAEAAFITKVIRENVRRSEHGPHPVKYGDHAILYRMNAQSNTVERQLFKDNIPYKIVGGLRFYDRKEIKDMLAYLNLINNPGDDLRLTRVINEPKRGIGQTTVERLAQTASDEHTSIFDVICRCAEYPAFAGKVKLLEPFAELIRHLQAFEKEHTLPQLYDELLEKTGYGAAMLAQGEEGLTRLENINELKSNLAAYTPQEDDETNLTPLEAFLSDVALYTDLDTLDEKADSVTLMTVHSAKGLEFPNVFIVGMEETLFPSQRADMEGEVEEERRLAYVAITRAKESLYLTTAAHRMIFGRTTANKRSRFVDEIDPEALYTYDQAAKHQEKLRQQITRQAHKISNHKPKSLVSVGAQTQQTQKKEFIPGDRINHAVFGAGEVRSVRAMGNDSLIEISFESGQTKRIMANFAPLEKL